MVLWLDSSETLTMASMSQARAKHGCAMTDQHYVVAGGVGVNGEQLATVEVFNFRTGPVVGAQSGYWESLTPLPRARVSPGLAYSNGQLVIVGGQNEETPDTRVLYYDDAAETRPQRWTQWGQFNTTRYGHVTVSMQQLISHL